MPTRKRTQTAQRNTTKVRNTKKTKIANGEPLKTRITTVTGAIYRLRRGIYWVIANNPVDPEASKQEWTRIAKEIAENYSNDKRLARFTLYYSIRDAKDETAKYPKVLKIDKVEIEFFDKVETVEI